MRIDNKPTVEVAMRPVCECGFVFEELYYNKFNNRFAPSMCPNCKRIIETFRFDDLTKRKSDENGDICICEPRGDFT